MKCKNIIFWLPSVKLAFPKKFKGHKVSIARLIAVQRYVLGNTCDRTCMCPYTHKDLSTDEKICPTHTPLAHKYRTLSTLVTNSTFVAKSFSTQVAKTFSTQVAKTFSTQVAKTFSTQVAKTFSTQVAKTFSTQVAKTFSTQVAKTFSTQLKEVFMKAM